MSRPTRREHASRKDEHLELALRLHRTDRPNAFDDVSFVHHALPAASTREVDVRDRKSTRLNSSHLR